MTLTIDIGGALKAIGLVLFLGVAVAIVALLIGRIRRFFAGRAFDGTDREKMRARWTEIERTIDSGGEMGRKLAIIEADKLLDHALKALSMPGQTLGDRLKFAQYKYPELRDVWWAHKIRNQIAHEATYHLDSGMAKSALKTFRRALERLGAL